MATLADISDLLVKVLGSSIGPIPFFVVPALALGIGVAVWFLKANVKKEVVMDASKRSRLQTAEEWLRENVAKDAGGVGFEPTKVEGLRTEDNNGKVDLEDRLISALISAVSRAQVSSGTKLSLIVNPSATKKLSLGKSQIDFVLNATSDGQTENPLEKIPPIPEDGSEAQS